MKPEEQRIKIAEACGWEVINDTLCNVRPDRNGDPEIEPVAPLPDYLNDLNAMREVEEVLTDEQDLEYSEFLALVVKARWGANNSCDMQRLRSATAAQRAEAFLKTLELWEETK